MIRYHSYLKVVKAYINKLIYSLGIVFLLMICLSFSDLPFWGYYNLGVSGTDEVYNPDYIVLLGSHGMPSPEGLIRCYYAAELAKKDSTVPIIIALPAKENEIKSGDLNKMRKELIIRNIDSNRIFFETKGTNTHEQAENIAKITGFRQKYLAVKIVTSPEHICRSVLSFKKTGFCEVGGIATFEKNLEQDILIKKKKKKMIDKLGDNLALRYNVWNYLKYEIIVIREYIAIFYYKLKGWI